MSLGRCGLMALIIAVSSFASADPGPVPQWLWSDVLSEARPDETERTSFATSFEVRPGLKTALLDGLADDRLTVTINATTATEIRSSQAWTTTDVTQRLHAGRNQIRLDALNQRGAAGVCVRLRLEYADGRREVVVTDPTWKVAVGERRSADVSQWPYAVSLGLLGIQPWGDPAGASGDYHQWKKALGVNQAEAAATMQVTPGFEVELVRSAQPGESSWISLTFDPQGRAIIGREGRDKRHGLLRLTLPEKRGGEAQVESLEETLLEPRGLAFRGDDLFVNANNALSLVRLKDADRDGRFEDLTVLKKSPGGVGHGRNNLCFGPDGSLFSIHGNDVRLPDDVAESSSRCVHTELDRLLPCRWDRFLFDRNAKLPAGHLIRTNAAGDQWELFACGFRNPYGIDFNPDGELFTFDADNEGDLGSPWYRPTRINHIVPGGDYGWRQGTSMRPEWYPDSLPSNLNIGKSSPTDIKFGTHSNYPPRYRKSLFILDWTYGRIYAVQLLPRGASYVATAEVFLEGRPLNVTDLEFGPDGAMYFTTGGRGTQSGLYRVSYVGPESVIAAPPSVSPEEVVAAVSARLVRRKLEDLQQVGDVPALQAALAYVGDRDPWIRHAARLVVERQPVERWRFYPLIGDGERKAAMLLMALARSADRKMQLDVLKRLSAMPIRDCDLDVQLTFLRAMQLSLIRIESLPDNVATGLRTHIESLYPTRCWQVNQFACEVLVHLKSEQVVPKTIELLRAADTQEEKLLWLFELRNVPNGWTLEHRQFFQEQLIAAEAFDGGRELPVGLFSIAAEFRATLPPEDARILSEQAAKARPIETPTSLIPQRPLVREWTLDDLVGRLEEVSRDRNIERGKRVFREANCGKCHRFAGEGRSIGPDLRAVGARLGRKDLLETILMPSKVIDDKYRDVSFELKSGRHLTGRLIGGDDVSLLISPNAHLPFDALTIHRDEVETQKVSPLSPMPAGLLNSFTAEDVLDLLAYLEAGGV